MTPPSVPPSEVPLDHDDFEWNYLCLEPREAYDEAIMGVLPVGAVAGDGEREYTHVAVYCRIKTLICLSRVMGNESPWKEVLEYHYFNQDSQAYYPFPMYSDPPEEWESLKTGRWPQLLKELKERLAELPEDEDP
jgi:hypothetical protein